MSLIYQTLVTGAVTIGLVATLATSNFADVVEYDDVLTDLVAYTSIVESSESIGELHGQPFAGGDSIVSGAVGFASESSSGEDDLTAGLLTLTITAEAGMVFNELTIFSSGNFSGTGTEGVLGAHSAATVTAGSESFANSMIFHSIGGAADTWQGEYTVTFDPTNQVSLSLLTQLRTDADIGASAFVDLSQVQLSVNFTAIPEPITAGWLVLGLSLFGRRRWRG